MTLPDVVIPVRPGDNNPELRYALRSIAANVPHRHVWLVGHCPPWVTGVRHIPVEQERYKGAKYANVRANWSAACAHPEVSDPFVSWHDDMFAMRPVDHIPPMHLGTVRGVIDLYESKGIMSRYLRGMIETYRYLRSVHGIEEPLSYEAHVPRLVDKAKRAHAAQLAAQSGIGVPHLRTIYGNVFAIGGELVRDVKIHDVESVPDARALFVSTADHAFRYGRVGQWVRNKLRQPGPYELEVAA